MALFVLIATHSSDQCPTANEKTRKLFGADPAPIMALAQKLGVKPVVGPLVRTRTPDLCCHGSPEGRGCSGLRNAERPDPVEQR